MESTELAPNAPRATTSPDAAPGGVRTGAPLPAERVARIRERIGSGAYDAVRVADEVARRLLESGDL